MATDFGLVDRDELHSLLEGAPTPAVTLYLPTHRVGPETELDTVHLKNLLNDAFDRLAERGMRRPDIEKLLEPAVSLLGDGNFWRHQLDGLALFLAPGFVRHYRLPFEVEEHVEIGESFYVTPILPALSVEGYFFILAISQNRLRLLRATRYGVEEMEIDDLDVPKDLAEAMQFDNFQRRDGDLQHRPAKQGQGAGRQMFHGHGPGGEDIKDEILRYFQAVDRGLGEILRTERAPLVIASVDYLQPLFRSASHYQNIVGGGVDGNPDRMNPAEIHRRALPVVEPYLRAGLDAAKERYGAGQSNGRSSCDLGEVLGAAHEGRIDALFLRRNERVPGSFDPESRRIVTSGGEGTDLLDLAARRTLLASGEVLVVGDEDMPCVEPAGAVFRY